MSCCILYCCALAVNVSSDTAIVASFQAHIQRGSACSYITAMECKKMIEISL